MYVCQLFLGNKCVEKYLAKGNVIYWVFIDFKQVYEKVDGREVSKFLLQIGVRKKLLKTLIFF